MISIHNFFHSIPVEKSDGMMSQVSTLQLGVVIARIRKGKGMSQMVIFSSLNMNSFPRQRWLHIAVSNANIPLPTELDFKSGNTKQAKRSVANAWLALMNFLAR